jgi:hypothetical protein
VVEGQLDRDRAAERVPDDVGLVDAEFVQQRLASWTWVSIVAGGWPWAGRELPAKPRRW